MKKITLKIKDMHCTSCALSIDLDLEELPGVKAKTNYAKSKAEVEYDPNLVTEDKIISTIAKAGYQVVL